MFVGANMYRTAIHGQTFISDIKVEMKQQTASFINVKLARIGGRVWLLSTDDTAIIERPPLSLDGVANIVETSAGIGAGGQGFKECGAETVAFCDYNKSFCEWLERRTKIPVIHGNIADIDTIRQLDSAIGDRSHVLHGGVACQPFSKLGDQKQGLDTRSESFVGLLQTGFHLGSIMIIMECTPAAMTSQWGQTVLLDFVKQTGYKLHQSVIDIASFWPSKRQRWWAVLTHPQLPCDEIPQMPSINWDPTVFHLLPKMKTISQSDLNQLELDLYELRHFHDATGGISRSVFNPHKVMPTATHSWGSQVKGCHCKCRSSGFSEARLAAKGLYGVLIPLGDTTTNGNNTYHRMRHPHPEEIAILNGLSPKEVVTQEGETQRLALAGVGQLASPLQAAWVYSNALWAIHQAGIDLNIDNPRQIIADMCRDLFKDRDIMLKNPAKTRYMDIFERAINAIDHPSTFPPKDETNELPNLTQAIHQRCIELEAHGVENDQVEVANIDSRIGKGKGGLTPKSSGVANAPVDCQASDSVLAQIRPEQKHSVQRSEDNSQNPKRKAFAENGGVTGFETNKKLKSKNSPTPAIAKPNDDEISPTIPWQAHEDESHESKVKQDSSSSKITVWVGFQNEKLHPVVCNTKSTVGQITVAESKLQHIEPPTIARMSVGPLLSASSVAYDDQIIILHEGRFAEEDKCPELRSSYPPDVIGIPREHALWHQKGWVALDEMEFYLQDLNQKHSFTSAPFAVPDRPDASTTMCSWIYRALEIAAATDKAYQTCTACLYKNHWIPIFLQISEHETSITTTIENEYHVRNLVNCIYPDIIVQLEVSQQAFPADCGFQTLAWIQKTLHQQIGSAPSQYPMSPETADKKRRSFACYLKEHGSDQHVVKTLPLGGMGDGIKQKLQQLLENHGVKSDRSDSCATHLIHEIGSASIQKTLASPEPWRDLKTKANQHKPPIKIVLAEELKAIIDGKIAEGHQFGRKANKKHNNQNSSQWKGLNASQVHVPSNVFKQEDGTSLEQISVQQFNQHAAGIAVVNIREALPFFSLAQHLSQEGLGLIILDHQDSRIPECKQIIRFPANCPETDEPMLVTAALLQLGKKKVLRHTPENCTTVEEIRTLVVRALVYKDQYSDQPWTTFVSSPVKHLMNIKEFRDQPEQTILDVWDRQYLNKHFQRTKPLDADVFVVSIRVTESASDQILAASGVGGIFFEPRNDSGRSPLQSYGVVWMPRKQLGEVMLAKQTSQFPTWIVRTGDRYGLRVEEKHLSELHKIHRPDIEYLEGQTMTMYRLGPMPYGTTKQSLQKVFREWGWKARAGQPQGQDAYGVMWSAQATEDPTHWVFTLSHGDILITKLQSAKDKYIAPANAPLTSHRTLQHLTTGNAKKAWDKTQQDPWTYDDPWGQAVSKPSPSISPTQLTTIESNIEKRILAQLPVPTQKVDDMELETEMDHRVAHLETQVQQLKETVQQASASMQSFQHQQAQQNQQLSQQVHAVKHQVDSQNQHLQTMIEGKLEEQMSRIESLLTKRMKTHE